MFSELVARNARRARRENRLFFVSLIVSVVAFYIILSLAKLDVIVFLRTIESDAVDKLLSLAPAFYALTLFILFFLVYFANRFQLGRRRHELGMYLMLGMRRSRLFCMLVAEDARTSVVALAVGLPIGVLVAEVTGLVTARLVDLDILGHQMTFSVPALAWTALGFFGIKLLASLLLSGRVVRQEIGSLLVPTPEGAKRQLPAAVYVGALVAGVALLAAAYGAAIQGAAWKSVGAMALTLAAGVAGTVALFFGLRVVVGALARREGGARVRGARRGGTAREGTARREGAAAPLRVFNFRQVEETVIHRSGTLAISSLLILAALCCFGAGVSIARSAKAETHVLDYTFDCTTGIEAMQPDTLRQTLAHVEAGEHFAELFELRVGGVHTTEDYSEAVRFDRLVETIAALPATDARDDTLSLMETRSYPPLLAASGYNRVLAAAGLPEVSLAPNEVALYADPDIVDAARREVLDAALAAGATLTIDGETVALVGTVQHIALVTDRAYTPAIALIFPDEAFDRWTCGVWDTYLNGILAPAFTEGRSLIGAYQEMNAALDAAGLTYDCYLQNMGRELFYVVAASYLTMYLAIVFLLVANTVIGVQFLMGQQRAAGRYRTLVRLGATYETLCRAARRQVNWFFGLPVGVAAASSLVAVRALFSGLLTSRAQSNISEMMVTAGAMIALLLVAEVLYMSAVKRASDRALSELMAPQRME